MTKSVSATVGTLIVVGIRWVDRLIGLISTLILARLLVPEDFGIIAMASLVIGLIDVLLDMGVNITLVQNKNATKDDFDAAWTLRLIQSSIATIILFFTAYPAATYFNDGRVTPVIQALALSVLLVGLENIGIVSFQKKMEFGQEFKYFFSKRMIGFLATMAAALVLRSYWALVIGTLCARFAGVVLSYAMHPLRPTISFVRMRPTLAFSSWNLLRGISNYLGENLHRLLVGRRESSALMGAYTLASDVTAIPSTELLAPINRVLFPVLVQARDDPEQLKKIFFLAVGVQSIVGVPAGVGLALVAPELVAAMLGEKWAAAVPFVQIMGSINVVTALSVSGGYLWLALGRVTIATLHSWGQVALFMLLTLALFPKGGAETIAQIRLCVSVVGLLTFVMIVLREFPTWRPGDMLACVWRPCVAAGAMAAILLYLTEVLSMQPLPLLLYKTIAGASAYALCLVAIWHWSGCPDGAEAFLLGKIKSALATRSRPK